MQGAVRHHREDLQTDSCIHAHLRQQQFQHRDVREYEPNHQVGVRHRAYPQGNAYSHAQGQFL